MKHFSIISLLAIVTIFGISNLVAADIKVIANPSVGAPAVSARWLTRLEAMLAGAGTSLPERLVALQDLMAAGDARAAQVYQTIGTYLGYALLAAGRLEEAFDPWERGVLGGLRGTERDTGVPHWMFLSTSLLILTRNTRKPCVWR